MGASCVKEETALTAKDAKNAKKKEERRDCSTVTIRVS
jgi:hypothetical protein